ncbi:MAG: hypothetical protein HZA29_02590 [Candidatus Omnitrophica bacterium]|nr:hypothetical protein [Candidatus Omnitrophota bacterium]
MKRLGLDRLLLAKTSRATAFREIADLVEKKVLVQNPESKGRSVSYDLDQ